MFNDRLQFLLNRITERLWVRPLVMCVLSIFGALVASITDRLGLEAYTPEITLESIEALLNNLSASMLVIATFSVGSMITSYASASRTATPRSLPLVLADDVSQNALATFIGAFIFSVVATVAIKNGYYGSTGRFTLFVFTGLVFAAVVLTFVRWVDRIARLGLLSMTIESVEDAAAKALQARGNAPRLGGIAVDPDLPVAWHVYSDTVGYVQRIDIDRLQELAESAEATITVAALPGTFAMPGRALASVSNVEGDPSALDADRIAAAFTLGRSRTFDEDPRFALIALAEIGARALSPAVNDPGTAIAVISACVRLFTSYHGWAATPDSAAAPFSRVAVPEICAADMFDDAFSAIARDGAASAEVVIRLLKGLEALTLLDDPALGAAARRHALRVMERVSHCTYTKEESGLIAACAAFARDD